MDLENHRPRELPSHPLVVIFFFACVGICVDRAYGLPPTIWWGLAVCALFGWLLFRFHRAFGNALLCIAVAASMGCWHHLSWSTFAIDEVGIADVSLDGEARPVCVEATILDSLQVSPGPPEGHLSAIPDGDETRSRVRIARIRDGDQWRSASGIVKLKVEGHLLGLYPGDQVQIFGKLGRIPPATNPLERDMSLIARADRQLCMLQVAYPNCVELVEANRLRSISRFFQRLRGTCDGMLWSYLSHERHGLAAAILLGARQRLPDERTEPFFHTGTIHLLAISGLHVGILAWAFFFAASRKLLPQKLALVAVMILSIGYALMTEARAPVIRATILIQVVCLGQLAHRSAFGFNTLAAAGLVVLALNPADLFRAGPQLSFVAVASLTLLSMWSVNADRGDAFDRFIERKRPPSERFLLAIYRRMRRLLLASCLIWLVTLPIVMQQFRLVSPVAILLNVVLWIPVAVALFSGIIVLSFGWLFPPIARVAAVCCDQSLWCLESVVDWAEQLPGAYAWVAPPGWMWVGAFYTFLLAIFLFPRLRLPRRWNVAVGCVWIASPILIGDFSFVPSPFRATFIDVGHGTSVLLEIPSGERILYDCGRFGGPEAAVNAIGNVLWSRGIRHLDTVVLSHADSDHYNAVPGLLERFSVGSVIVSDQMFADRSEPLDTLRAAIERHNVPIQGVASGDVIRVNCEMKISVLHPPKGGVGGSDNANSIVLLVQENVGGHSLLLPGDLEPPGFERLLITEHLDVSCAMAPHHGSKNSLPAEFAQWCTPEQIIVSGSRKSKSSVVESAFRDAGAQVVYTFESGAVTVTLDSEMLIETFVKSPTNAP